MTGPRSGWGVPAPTLARINKAAPAKRRPVCYLIGVTTKHSIRKVSREGAHLYRSLNMNAEYIARQLKKSSRSGAGWIACCPAHDDKTPSLSICDDNGRILWKCFAGCSQEDVGNELKRRGLLEHSKDVPPPSTQKRFNDFGEQASKIEKAQIIWAGCTPARGTLVEEYLKSRGINYVPNQLRFYRNLWHSPGIPSVS